METQIVEHRTSTTSIPRIPVNLTYLSVLGQVCRLRQRGLRACIAATPPGMPEHSHSEFSVGVKIVLEVPNDNSNASAVQAQPEASQLAK